MKGTKIISLCMLILSLTILLLAGCSGSEKTAAYDPSADKLNAILNEGKMLVVMDASFSPIDFTNPESGNIEGLVVDIISLYAEKLGVEVELMDMEWSGLLPGVMNGDYDIAATHLTRSVPRTAKVALSDPYIITGTVGIVKNGSPIAKFSELNSSDIKIGTTKGNIYIEMIEKNFPEAELLLFDSKMDWTEALKTGRIDCVIESEIAATDMFRIYEDTFSIIPDGYYDSETYGFAVKYGEWGFKNSLDMFLQEIKLSGTYAELYKKWMGRPWTPNMNGGGV